MIKVLSKIYEKYEPEKLNCSELSNKFGNVLEYHEWEVDRYGNYKKILADGILHRIKLMKTLARVEFKSSSGRWIHNNSFPYKWTIINEKGQFIPIQKPKKKQKAKIQLKDKSDIRNFGQKELIIMFSEKTGNTKTHTWNEFFDYFSNELCKIKPPESEIRKIFEENIEKKIPLAENFNVMLTRDIQKIMFYTMVNNTIVNRF